MSVTTGLECLVQSNALEGQRVGLVANPASLHAQFTHAADLVNRARGAKLAALFGPQHGYQADLQDNMIETPHARDAARNVPVYSLYSETREPTADMLQELDVLVVDLQDVGTRVYTFVYTMANCLRAAARIGIPVIVCDRPNPIGGVLVQGPVLETGCESFVGQFPIPLRHGMTIGELARLFNDAFGLGARLMVSPMKGWRRELFYDECGLPWVMPSPNMPTLDTAVVYPGAVLFEGTKLSEGRGTTKPFEIMGAPEIDPNRLAAELNAQQHQGAYFRPVLFEPTFHKHAGRTCGGCQLHVTDRTQLDPVAAAVAWMVAIRAQAPDVFDWRPPPYEYEHEKMPIDILAGSPAFRRAVESGESARSIASGWKPALSAFDRLRSDFLIYA
ncbi:MAG: exo-beta-N-acetylmuramidase NamZ domain-containing protein [Vicinamibacterales bacterium]